MLLPIWFHDIMKMIFPKIVLAIPIRFYLQCGSTSVIIYAKLQIIANHFMHRCPVFSYQKVHSLFQKRKTTGIE